MAEQEYFYAIGRRKTSTATLRLYFKKGKNTINGKNLEVVYPSRIDQAKIEEALKIAEIEVGDVMYTVKTVGGGIMSQVDAIKLALARAIIKKYPEKKKDLKNAGLLIRDPRMVERKKAGLLKARKAEQYSKR